MRLSLFIFTLVSLCIMSVHAEIYTCKDAEGNTIYTDSPSGCANAEEVEVDALPDLITTKPTTSINSNRAVKKEEAKSPYSELEITSPSNDSNIRNNQGNLTIKFRVAPGLIVRAGHKFVVSVDGAEVYSGTNAATSLKNLDRGTHTIGVKVVDAKGKVLITSDVIKTTLQRFSARSSIDQPSSGAVPTIGTTNPGQFNFPKVPRASN